MGNLGKAYQSANNLLDLKNKTALQLWELSQKLVLVVFSINYFVVRRHCTIKYIARMNKYVKFT